MEAHELFDYAAQQAWDQVKRLNEAAEKAWAEYDEPLQRARLAEDAMWAAHKEPTRLSRATREQALRADHRTATEARNGSH